MTDKPDEREEECTPTKRHSWHRLGGIDDCPVCNPDDTPEQAPRPREWWILKESEDLISEESMGDDSVHVIEKSAYDSLVESMILAKKQRDAALAELERVKGRDEDCWMLRAWKERGRVRQIQKQLDALRAENERLTKHLDEQSFTNYSLNKLKAYREERDRYREALGFLLLSAEKTCNILVPQIRKALEQGE